MADYQRAYSAEHKAEHLEEIKAATDRLFAAQGFHGVTLASIANELGWSRGNLYRYAHTKEEIFLDLYRDRSAAYVRAIARAFPAPAVTAGPLPVAEFARRWAEVTNRHHDYLRYQTLLTSVIETNMPLDVLTAFKHDLETDVQSAIAVVQRQVPGLGVEAASTAYRALVYHAAALHGHLHGPRPRCRPFRPPACPCPRADSAANSRTSSRSI